MQEFRVECDASLSYRTGLDTTTGSGEDAYIVLLISATGKDGNVQTQTSNLKGMRASTGDSFFHFFAIIRTPCNVAARLHCSAAKTDLAKKSTNSQSSRRNHSAALPTAFDLC